MAAPAVGCLLMVIRLAWEDTWEGAEKGAGMGAEWYSCPCQHVAHASTNIA